MVSYRRVGNQYVRVGGQGARNAPKTIAIPDKISEKVRNRQIMSGKRAGDAYQVTYTDTGASFIATKPEAGAGVMTLVTPGGQVYQSRNLGFLQAKQLALGGTIDSGAAVPPKPSGSASQSAKSTPTGPYLPAGTKDPLSGRALSQDLPISPALATKLDVGAANPATVTAYYENGKLVSIGRPPEPMTPQLGPKVVRAATEEESKALRRQNNPLYQAYRGFVGVLTGNRNAINDESTLGSRNYGVLQASRTTGAALAAPLGVLTASKVAPYVSSAYTASRTASFFPKLAVDTALTYGVFRAGAETSRKVADITRPQYGQLTPEEFTATRDRALARASITPQSGFVNAISSLGVGKSEFTDALRKELRKKGLKGAELELAVRRGAKEQATFGAQEWLGLVALNSATETIGQSNINLLNKRMVAQGASMTWNQYARKTFAQIGAAGIAEGVGQVTQRSYLRGEEQYNIPFTTIPISRNVAILGGGAIGFVSAGAIGSTIVKYSPTKIKIPFTKFKVGAGDTIATGANLADVAEAPGDSLSRLAETLAYRFTGRKAPEYVLRTNVKTGVVTATMTPTTVKGETVTSTASPGPKSSAYATMNVDIPRTRTDLSTFTTVKANTMTRTIVPSTPKSTPVLISTFVSTKTKPPTRNDVPVMISPKTMVPVSNNVPVSVKTDTRAVVPVNTKINVPINTNVNIPVNVNTNPNVMIPTVPVPPIMNLPAGGGGGFKFRRISKRKQPKAYTPSAFAAITGFVGKRPSKASISTGLAVRPIIKKFKTRTIA